MKRCGREWLDYLCGDMNQASGAVRDEVVGRQNSKASESTMSIRVAHGLVLDS